MGVQVGIITVDGVQIGVIMQSEEDMDTTTPLMPEGGNGNSQLGDYVEGSQYRHTPAKGHAGGHHKGSAKTSSGHAEGSTKSSSSDGMDAYGDGDAGKAKEKSTPSKNDGTPYTTSGNPFARDRFRQELKDKPWLVDKMAHISLGENQDPTANLAVQETALNRAVVRGTSLEQQLKRHRSSGKDEGGYYAGWAPTYSPEKRKMFDENLEKALAGSNVTNYATDNSSGALAASEKANGRFVHHKDFNRESFFSPGSAEPVLRDRWQRLHRQAIDHEKSQKTPVAAATPFDGVP